MATQAIACVAATTTTQHATGPFGHVVYKLLDHTGVSFAAAFEYVVRIVQFDFRSEQLRLFGGLFFTHFQLLTGLIYSSNIIISAYR